MGVQSWLVHARARHMCACGVHTCTCVRERIDSCRTRYASRSALTAGERKNLRKSSRMRVLMPESMPGLMKPDARGRHAAAQHARRSTSKGVPRVRPVWRPGEGEHGDYELPQEAV